MTTLNDIYLDEYGSLICKQRLSSKEWDELLKQLFEEWMEMKKNISSNPVLAEENCVHPYAEIYRKMYFEKCSKCGKVLCEG